MVKFTKPLNSGGDDPAPSEGLPFPMSHAETVRLLKQIGAVPEFIPDDTVVVHAYRPSTGQTQRIAAGYEGSDDTLSTVAAAMFGQEDEPREWHLDDIFPHTRYDDPPGTLTEDEYKRLLLDLLDNAGRNLEEFTRLVCAGLGTDLVMGHDVPQDLATQVCEDFAAKVYREFTGDA